MSVPERNDKPKPNRELAIITKILERLGDRVSNIETNVAKIEDSTTKLETEIKAIIDHGDQMKDGHVKWLQTVIWTIIGAIISAVGYVGIKFLDGGK